MPRPKQWYEAWPQGEPDIRIDKGIPVPTSGSTRACELHKTLSMMAVGDSIVIPPGTRNPVKYANSAFTPRVFVSRKVGKSNTRRVWRTK